MRCSPLPSCLFAVTWASLLLLATAHGTIAQTTAPPAPVDVIGDSGDARGSLQHTHYFGADPGMAALRLFLGAGGRLDTLARTAAEAAYGGPDLKSSIHLLYTTHVFAPGDDLSLRRLGFAAKTSGYYELAYDALRHATTVNPDSYEAWWWLADTDRLLGFYDEAVEHMGRARDLAPATETANLQDFVTYSENLANPERTWDTFNTHRDFAQRHRDTRRVRRAAAEYQATLDHAPSFAPDNTDAWARIAWISMQMGYQYAFLQEHETAAFYFEQAARLYGHTLVPLDVGRCLNDEADSFAVLAVTEPAQRNTWLDQAIQCRERALDLNQNASDPVQSRYTVGRLLEDAVTRYGTNNPRVAELRLLAVNELPWSGAIEDFSLVAMAEGEAACRLAEGDLGGARQLFERIRPYLAGSEYLSNTFRVARLDYTMAYIHQQQGHAGAAIEAAQNALASVAQARTYLHAEAFLRSPAAWILRYAHCAVARGALSMGDFAQALATTEAYHATRLNIILDSATPSKAIFADRGIEVKLAKARLDSLAALRAEAKADGDSEALAWAAANEARENEHLQQIRTYPQDAENVGLERIEEYPVGPNALQQALPADALYIAYLTDPWGSCAVTAGTEGLGGATLDGASEAMLLDAVLAFQQAIRGNGDAAAPLQALAQALMAPLAATLGQRRLLIAPDDMLYTLPFAALPLANGFLVQQNDVALVTSAAQIVQSMEYAPTPGEGALVCRAAEGGSEAMLYAENHPLVAYIEAPVDVWPGAAPLSALLLRPGGGEDGRLHLSEIATHVISSAVTLCLGDGWPPTSAPFETVQSLAHSLKLAGTGAAVFNLWPADCATMRDGTALNFSGAHAFCAWQRDAIAAGSPLSAWSNYQFYGPLP